MFIAQLTLAIAIAISIVAAWYSIVGLIAIFAAAAIPIAIMGAVLELGKIVAVSWLYNNWKTSNKILRTYLTVAVVVLMFITSMGIFGYLSKAHIDQTLIGGDNSLDILSIDQQIEREQRSIDDANKVIGQLDRAVQTLIDAERISGARGAVAVRESQSVERSSLTGTIDDISDRIKRLRDQKKELSKQQLKIEAEVGPIKYIASLFTSEPKKILEDAVRWVIITIIFVFDPLAIGLLIAANSSLNKPRAIKTAVNVADGWKDFSVEQTDEFSFKIKDEIVQAPENTVEVNEEWKPPLWARILAQYNDEKIKKTRKRKSKTV